MKLVAQSVIATASANIFLHVPRGSQNRLQEDTADNTNNHRLFWANHNSEYTRRGGYNVGEKTTKKADNEDGHYHMQYFMSGPDLPTKNPETPGNSYLTLEWTQLLGCGQDADGDSIQGCETKIQINCQDDLADGVQPSTLDDLTTIRNGAVYETIDFKPDGSHLPDPKGGCYVDSHDRDIPYLANIGILHQKTDAIQFCKDTCKDKDYLYAAVQNGNECRCGNDFGKYGKGAATSCNRECHDKQDQICGGGWRNQVYLSGLAKETPDETKQEKDDRKAVSKAKDHGLHESWEFYDRCPDYFELTGIKEKRSGLECLHERNHISVDYTTPWRDIVHFSDDVAKCQADQEAKRQPKSECVEYWPDGSRKHKSEYTKKSTCKDNGGNWLEFYEYKQLRTDLTTQSKCKGENLVWGRPMNWADLSADKESDFACLDLGPKAECLENFDTRHNYLGMADKTNEVPRHQWAIPKYVNNQRCVLRIRQFIYNNDEPQITETNKDLKDQYHQPLYLALPQKYTHNNMVVYEDRSHIFKLIQRPDSIPDDKTLHNIVVRGKRGNIVQTYPAVEYDFVPNKLTIKNGDAVQFQWTGSNTHDNGGRSDGQTGDAGEGNGGTDRNNMIQNFYKKTNFPLPYEKQSLFQNAEFLWSEKFGEHDSTNVDKTDDTISDAITSYNAALAHATSGHYWSTEEFKDKRGKNKLDGRLNNASPSFQGVVFVPGKDSKYYYVGMRNNNFSNRSQKGELTVGNVDVAAYEQDLKEKLKRERPENPCEQYGSNGNYNNVV